MKETLFGENRAYTICSDGNRSAFQRMILSQKLKPKWFYRFPFQFGSQNRNKQFGSGCLKCIDSRSIAYSLQGFFFFFQIIKLPTKVTNKIIATKINSILLILINCITIIIHSRRYVRFHKVGEWFSSRLRDEFKRVCRSFIRSLGYSVGLIKTKYHQCSRWKNPWPLLDQNLCTSCRWKSLTDVKYDHFEVKIP